MNVMLSKPGSIADEDKISLREAGVVVIEVQNFDDVKFIDPIGPLSTTALLQAAGAAIARSSNLTNPKDDFGRSVAQILAALKD